MTEQMPPISPSNMLYTFYRSNLAWVESSKLFCPIYRGMHECHCRKQLVCRSKSHCCSLGGPLGKGIVTA